MPRTLRRATAALAIAALSAFAAPAALAQTAGDPAQRLASALELTEAQAALVQRHLGAEREPGALWRLSADLAPTLTDAQKEALFARPERGRARDRQAQDGRERRARTPSARPEGAHRAERPARADRPARAERAPREAMQARAQASQQAMREALALTPGQVAALEASRGERREQMQDRRAERAAAGAVPAPMASVLTADQQEVWLVHRALSSRLMGGQGQPQRARPGQR